MQLMTQDEVAALFGWSPRTFANNYRRLEQDGFPKRLPGRRFYLPAVEAWMARRSGMVATAPAAPLEAQRRHLETLYGGRAA